MANAKVEALSGLRIHSNLKPMLESRGMSIRQCAEKIGYRFESVRKLHNETITRIPVELLLRLCAEFNCEVGDIIEVRKAYDMSDTKGFEIK